MHYGYKCSHHYDHFWIRIIWIFVRTRSKKACLNLLTCLGGPIYPDDSEYCGKFKSEYITSKQFTLHFARASNRNISLNRWYHARFSCTVFGPYRECNLFVLRRVRTRWASFWGARAVHYQTWISRASLFTVISFSELTEQQELIVNNKALVTLVLCKLFDIDIPLISLDNDLESCYEVTPWGYQDRG